MHLNHLSYNPFILSYFKQILRDEGQVKKPLSFEERVAIAAKIVKLSLKQPTPSGDSLHQSPVPPQRESSPERSSSDSDDVIQIDWKEIMTFLLIFFFFGRISYDHSDLPKVFIFSENWYTEQYNKGDYSPL